MKGVFKMTEIKRECASCGEVMNEEDMLTIGDNFYCNDCSFICEKCECAEYIDNAVAVHEGNDIICYVCSDCAENSDSIFGCRDCGNYYFSSSRWGYYHDEPVCNSCSDNYGICDECGYTFLNDDLTLDSDSGDYLCSDCYSNANSVSNIVNEYYYKPIPIFYGDDTGNCFLGVELEVDNTDGTADLTDICNLARELQKDYDEHIYLKHDGSLSDNGFEIVSHPMSLDYHMSEFAWKEIMNKCVDASLRSHNTDSCGFHVHISRSFFGVFEEEQDLNIAKLLLLVSRFFESHIVKFTRRQASELNRWCAKPSVKYEETNTNESVVDKMKTAKSCGRYQAINLQNEKTVEFRMFKGTLKYSTFIASLQFVKVISEYAKTVKLNDIPTTQWSDIFMHSDYAELRNYMKEKELF